jgi:hypothetical protein
MGSRVVEKHRVRWTNQEDLFEFSYGAGHFSLQKWRKLRAQNTKKMFSSPGVEVYNDKYARDLYLSEPEDLEASTLSLVLAGFVPAWFSKDVN